MSHVRHDPITTIRLGGYLGRRYGRVHRLGGINTVPQAIEALNYLYPGLKKAIEEKEEGPNPYRYHVRINKRTIGEEKLGLNIEGKTINITPMVSGRGNSKGIIQTIAGVALIVIGAIVSIYGGAGIPIILAGVGYLFSGISSLIAGTPNTDSTKQGKGKESYAFSGPVNQTQQGGAVAVHYGENWIGSQTVSGSIIPTVVVTNATASGYGSSDAIGGGGVGGPSRPVYAEGKRRNPNGPALPIASVPIGGRGGGDSSPPKEAKISLISNQTMQILDCLGEGDTEGLGDHPLRNFALNGTPVENDDGTLNFKGIEFYYNNGTQDQQYIPGFESEEDTTAVNVELKHDTPWVQHFANTDLNAIRLVIQIPALQKYSTKGDIDPTRVTLQFELATAGGAYALLYVDTIEGYTPNPYTRGYEIPLDNGAGPWDVRVTRITEDSTSAKLVNKTVIASKSEIIHGKFRHPNRVMSGLRITADQFDGPPSRAWKEKGRRVAVPSNFDPVARTYSGNWDGVTWKTAWTNDPAWCWNDLLLHKRYGLGNFLDSTNVNRFALYRISQYCSQVIPDSLGGTQFRHSMNHYIQNRDEALKILSDMASNFRAMLYYINGEIVAVQDRAADYVAANYGTQKAVNGQFTYAGVPARNRHNTVYVTYSDPNNQGKPDVEPAEDQKDIARNGLIDDSIVGVGMASRGEARRAGEYEIITELIQDETVTFKTGFNGGYRMPGDVIAVSNPFRAGEKVTGLISTVDGTTVTLDRATTLLPNKGYQISVVIAADDDEGNRITKVIQRAVTNPAGNYQTLNIASAFDSVPAGGSQYILVRADLQPELWRVLTVNQDGIQSHEVTALKYNESKYDAVDRDFKLVYPPVTTLPNPTVCLPPGGVTVREVTANLPLGVKRELSISWEASLDDFIDHYRVSFNLNGGPWTDLPATSGLAIFLPFTSPGTYNFQVFARNSIGAYSTPSIASYTVDDTNPLPPFEVTGLELSGQANNTNFTGRDPKFDWRLNSPSQAQDIGSEDNGAAAGEYDPTFKDFKVCIYDGDGAGDPVWTEYVSAPNYTFTHEKNEQAFEALYPPQLQPDGTYSSAAQPKFTIGVQARDVFNGISTGQTLTVQNPPPAAPTNLSAVAGFQNIFLEFTKAPDLDLAATEVLVSPSGSINDVIVYDAGLASVFTQSGVQTGHTYTYWGRSRDTFGSRSALSQPTTAMPGTVGATDIAQFAVNATGAFGNIIVLQGEEFLNHTPTEIAIAWNNHTVWFQGKAYPIAAGATTDQYVYWIAGEGSYRTSQANPSDANPDWLNNNNFQIAVNVENTGVYEFAWYGFANAVIGSAYIMKAAIIDAHIANLAADKILAGSILSSVLFVGGGAATGAGAALTVNVVGGIVRSVTVNQGGAGYSQDTTILVSGPVGLGALVVPKIVNGSIAAVTVIRGGNGYTQGATALLNYGGFIRSANYTAGPNGPTQGYSLGSDGILQAVGAILSGEFRASILDTDCAFQNSNYPGHFFPVVSFGSQKITYNFAETGSGPATDFIFNGATVTHATEVLKLDGVTMFGVGYDPATIPDGNRRLSFGDGDNERPLALKVDFAGNFGSRATIWYRVRPTDPWTLVMKITNPVSSGSGIIYVKTPADSNLEFGISTCNQKGKGITPGADYIRNGSITVIGFNL